MINTRLTFGAGVNVTVGGIVAVAGGSAVSVGSGVSVGGGTTVGTEREANDPQLCSNNVSTVKIQSLLKAFKITCPRSYTRSYKG
jgi:hypothetical protein